MNFNVVEFIEKKKDNKPLSKEEIKEFVNLSCSEQIPNYQISACLMAVCINGLSDEETFHLTMAMRDSGKISDYPRIENKIKVDKHSTGGIGDSVTLVLLPLLAAAGLTSAKSSGKGLGFTGGTLDKLASVGIKTDLTYDESCKVFKKAGMVIIQQTSDVAPADGVFYALRDVTGSVMSIPLISSSIMSKKLALVNDFLFLDVKYGTGAFCKTLDMAKELADSMLRIAQLANLKTYIHITSMQQPLSSAIGNALEMKEAIEFLDGKCKNKRFMKLIAETAASIFMHTQIVKTHEDGLKKVEDLIESKAAINTFYKWAELQSADINWIKTGEYFKPANSLEVRATKKGYVSFASADNFGYASNLLGAGRTKKTDEIDYHAGIYVHVLMNDYVNEGDLLYTLYSSKKIPEKAIEILHQNTVYSNEKQLEDELIIHHNR